MANSRTLLVYVLALLVYGGSHSNFWGAANTVPILKERVAAPLPPASSQLHHHPQQLQPQQQHQQTQDTSVASPSPSTGGRAPSHPVPQPSNNAPSTMSVKNAWGLSAGNSKSGPYTSGYSYISGRTLGNPGYNNYGYNSYMTDYDLVEHNPSGTRTSNMMDGFASGFTGMFNDTFDWKSAAIGGIFTLFASYMRFPESLFAGLKPLRSTVTPAAVEKKEETTTIVLAPKKEPSSPSSNTTAASPVNNKVEDAKSETAKTRRRRDTQPDTKLTDLAAMVLSAIQSGECMQRSICLLGSQIGASNKGRLAFTLVDKLIPESVQGNQYFVTLKKALRGGESFCDKFRCHTFNEYVKL